jgi:hypothetical protein
MVKLPCSPHTEGVADAVDDTDVEDLLEVTVDEVKGLEYAADELETTEEVLVTNLDDDCVEDVEMKLLDWLEAEADAPRAEEVATTEDELNETLSAADEELARVEEDPYPTLEATELKEVRAPEAALVARTDVAKVELAYGTVVEDA